MSKKKIAIFHDYLNQYGGAERVLEKLLEIFPGAHVYTFVYDDEALPQFKQDAVITSPVQYLPFAKQHYQWYAWLFPIVIKLFNFSSYDVVIVSTHAWGNGICKTGAKMITYCHTPMRYIWDLYDEYMKNGYMPWLIRMVLPLVRPLLQRHDKRCAKNVDQFIANSKEVKQRIRTSYDRDAEVIYPPVKVLFFKDHAHDRAREHYLVVSRLKPYKRVDLVVKAFNRLNTRLIVVGNGPEKKALKRSAGTNIEFVSDINDEQLRDLYVTARGYIHMAHEDCGMTMIEAQAAGTPVIAYGKGGAREIVRDRETGILFSEQTEEALLAAIRMAEEKEWDYSRIQANAERFSESFFEGRIKEMMGGIAS